MHACLHLTIYMYTYTCLLCPRLQSHLRRCVLAYTIIITICCVLIIILKDLFPHYNTSCIVWYIDIRSLIAHYFLSLCYTIMLSFFVLFGCVNVNCLCLGDYSATIPAELTGKRAWHDILTWLNRSAWFMTAWCISSLYYIQSACISVYIQEAQGNIWQSDSVAHFT